MSAKKPTNWEGEAPAKQNSHVDNVNAEKVQYRFIEEGHGGTYSFASSQATSHIGTAGCSTCVGAYWTIDDDRCFIAHIFPCITDGSAPIVNASQADWLTKAIKEKLDTTARREKWPKDKSRMRDTLVLVCPRPESESGAHVGRPVISAILD